MPQHRLESHLGADLRLVRDLEELVALAQCAYSGQRPAGLAHEPHRRPFDRLAPQRADEERVGHGRTLARVDRRSLRTSPAGPLGVRWGRTSSTPRRPARSERWSRVGFQNAGADAWRDVLLAYHWLDGLRNAIVWDGLRSPLARLEPGARADAEVPVRADAARPYRLAFDLVLETAAGSRRSATSCSSPPSMSARVTPAPRSRTSPRSRAGG